jgi:hypothetical protein
MRAARATLIAILLAGVAAAAAASDMTLTRNGDLYLIVPSDDGLLVKERLTDGTVEESLIPQTAGIAAASVQVGVDELTGAVFVVWENGDDLDARVELAWRADGTWGGPFVVAGGDGSAARNPQLMIDRYNTIIDNDGDPIPFSATFLHLVWWSYQGSEDNGTAYLASVTIDEDGTPDFDTFAAIALADLLPYGIGCDGINNTEGLAYPKLFTDPQSGAPHVFATDFANCAFQILRLDYDVIEEWVGDTKRRRAITVWRAESMIALNPDMVLSSAKVEVGHGLDVLMYWETDDGVAYVQLSEDGMPPVQTLATGDDLNLEQAEDMVRSLVH